MFSQVYESGSDSVVSLEVLQVPEVTEAARTLPVGVGAELQAWHIASPEGLEPLKFRFREHFRLGWPRTSKYQTVRRSWAVQVQAGHGKLEACVLQVAGISEDRTMAACRVDVEDAAVAAIYAQRFNLHRRQQLEKEAHSGEHHEAMALVKVSVPTIARVKTSIFPALLPVGAVCCLWPYPHEEVQKFVFDGMEPFRELPQAFFHYATFSSNGKQMVCDLQGYEDDDGSILLIDPCVLKTEVAAVLAGTVAAKLPAPTAEALVTTGPTVERFNALHPQCAPMCQAFDPQRQSVQRNMGLCGTGMTCGLVRLA